MVIFFLFFIFLSFLIICEIGINFVLMIFFKIEYFKNEIVVFLKVNECSFFLCIKFVILLKIGLIFLIILNF